MLVQVSYVLEVIKSLPDHVKVKFDDFNPLELTPDTEVNLIELNGEIQDLTGGIIAYVNEFLRRYIDCTLKSMDTIKQICWCLKHCPIFAPIT